MEKEHSGSGVVGDSLPQGGCEGSLQSPEGGRVPDELDLLRRSRVRVKGKRFEQPEFMLT